MAEGVLTTCIKHKNFKINYLIMKRICVLLLNKLNNWYRYITYKNIIE